MTGEDGDCSLVHPCGFSGEIDLLPQFSFRWDVICTQLLPLSSPTSVLGPWFDVLRQGTAIWMVRGKALCSLDGFQGVEVTVGGIAGDTSFQSEGLYWAAVQLAGDESQSLVLRTF